MPKDDQGKVVCINHPQNEMTRYNAKLILPAIEIEEGKEDANINFDSGLLLVPFRCSECEYVELYNLNEPI